jgi:hypothetical protein
MVLEHFPPIGVALGIFPFVIPVYIFPAILVNLSEGNTLQPIFFAIAPGKSNMCSGPTASGHEANLKLTVLILSPYDCGHAEGRGGPR